jgi:hypothetical protein
MRSQHEHSADPQTAVRRGLACTEFLASELEARAAAPTAPAAIEMVPIATFARERSLNPATVRQMAAAGRIDAVRIGKRQWRVRRDSPIRSIRHEERAVSGRELAIERSRQLAARVTGGSR